MSLDYPQNYYAFAPLANGQQPVINTQDIDISSWDYYYEGMLNVLKDGIELPEVRNCFTRINFPTGESVELAFPELFVNMILWYSIVSLEKPIMPQYLWFGKTFTGNDVKNFIDKYVIIPNRATISNKRLNNIIGDTIMKFIDIDKFSMYFASTLNLEDSINLMQADPEYYNYLHCDLSEVPLEQVKDKGMEITYKVIDKIKNSKKYIGYNHCLKDAFEAHEGVKDKQYKENSVNIGTKPNGQGSIYHAIINQAYITGGVNTPLYQFIDSGSSRVAQIISKKSVGESGGFSRILGLNNLPSYLNPDENYDCHSARPIELVIENKDMLKRLADRYYYLNPNGQELKLNGDEDYLIGHTIWLRSPMTCESYARGHGICRHCYGDLYYVNRKANVGRYASELITEQLTQTRLSAKHILESRIVAIPWNDAFRAYFMVDINCIKISNEMDHETLKSYKLVIDPEKVQLENDDDLYIHTFISNHEMEDEGPFYDRYLTEFSIITPDEEEISIGSVYDKDTPETKMYLTSEFMNIIAEMYDKDLGEIDENNRIYIPMDILEDINLFYVKMENNDIGKSFDMFKDIINKKDITKSYTIDQIMLQLLNVCIKGNIHCRSVHLEVILSNQIRAKDDRLQRPDWRYYNNDYEILTLNEALTDNPAVVYSLVYNKLGKALYSPSTFQKQDPSIFDLFFVHKPKKFLTADHEIYGEQQASLIDKEKKENPMVYFKDGENTEYHKDMRKFINSISPRPKTEVDD